MAIVRGVFGGAQIRGSLSSVTFAQGPFGTVARARTPPVNPGTPRQTTVRSILSILSFAWSNTLTPTERDSWKQYADLTPLPDPFGGTRVVSGRMMFMRTNEPLVDALGAANFTAPPTPGVAFPITPTLGTTAASGLQITALDNPIDVGGIAQVLVSRPAGPARNFYKAPFTQVANLDSTDTFPFTLLGAGVVVAGQRYFVRVRHIDVDGKVSQPTIALTDLA